MHRKFMNFWSVLPAQNQPKFCYEKSSACELYTMTLSWTAVCFLCLCFDLAWNLANCHIVLFSYLSTLISLINKHAFLLRFFVNFCHHSFNFSCNKLEKCPPYFLFSCNKWKKSSHCKPIPCNDYRDLPVY